MGAANVFGLTLMLLAVAIFVYWTTWVFVMPYQPEDSPLQKYFLSRAVANQGPLYLLAAFFAFLATFLLHASIRQHLAKKNK